MATTVTKSIKPAGGGDYTSIAGWVAGQVGDFVTGDTIQRGECYAGQDTASVQVSGATTGAGNYWEIDVLPAERHAGKYDTAKYRLEPTDADGIKFDDEYSRCYGLQVSIQSPTAARIEVEFRFITGASDMRFSEFVVKGNTTNSYGVETSSSLTGTVKCSNGIVYDCDVTFSGGMRWSNGAGSDCRIYNVTVIDGYYGIRNSASAGTLVVKNCLCKGSSNGDFVNDTSWGTGTDYNAAGDATNTGGGHDRSSQTFTFADEAGNDFHLSASDAGAKGFGIDLSGDASYPITNDIDGQLEGLSWSIGADQLWAALAPGANAPTQRSGRKEPRNELSAHRTGWPSAVNNIKSWF